MTRALLSLCILLSPCLLAHTLVAQTPQPRPASIDAGANPATAQPRHGHGSGRGNRGGRNFNEDRQLFHFLLANHTKIRREVNLLSDGVQTITESDDPLIRAKIREHVKSMKERVELPSPIRLRDPLFAELFRHAEKISMRYENTDEGVKVTETSQDAYVVALIQEHAKVVSGFVRDGFVEAQKNHSPPASTSQPSPQLSKEFPKIDQWGGVFRLPNAAQQPRNASCVLVDVTGGGPPDTLLPSIEKVCRFVNIYAGAGKETAVPKIAMVLHGKATLAVLNDAAYRDRFETKENPNLECLKTLHDCGVEIYVCGQSLLGKDAKQEEVVPYVNVAVSALTANVNLQDRGYRYIPLSN